MKSDRKCLFAAVVAAAFALAAEQPHVTIFEDGAYEADIVLPAKVGGVEKYAAEELAYHFTKAFGKTPEVVGEDALDPSRHPFHIYVGATKAATAAGLPVGTLADEEHVVKAVGNGLYLLGGDADTTYSEVGVVNVAAMRGTLYAVYDFLENEMGVKWLWPGEIGEVVPRRAALKIGAVDRRGQEPLESRMFAVPRQTEKIGFAKDEHAEKFFREQDKFLVRQRHGRRKAFPSGHAFGNWWDKYHEKHPEYFNLLPNGKRMPQRSARMCTLCVSEPGVRLQRVKEWKAWWAKASTARHPPYPWVNCCENDYPGLCICERCRSWDGPDPRFAKSPYWNGSLAKDFDKTCMGRKFMLDIGLSNGSRWGSYPIIPTDELAASLSDRYVRFYNEVAAEAKKYNPEAKAIGYAYANYIEPPLKTRVGPDTVIIFVPRSYFPYDKVESEVFREQWGGWWRMGATRMVYRPNYMLAGGNYPIDTARLILDDFAFAATNGMFAVQQDSLTGAWSAHAMHLYAMTRALRDPLRGYAKAREDMLSGFGNAAKAIDRYFNLVERHSAKWTNESFREIGFRNVAKGYMGGSFPNPNAILGDFFDEKFFVSSYAIFDDAARLAADDADVKARIEHLRKGVRDTELGRLCRIAQKASEAAPEDAAKKAAYADAFKALLAYRASVEGDLVCNYNYCASKERFFGWPHKARSQKPKPSAAAGSSFTNDLEYLKKKWRTDVTDAGTGLDTDGVLAGWREIVAARGDEPWETTKAKLFAFGCDRTAIGVSPHDWFPAFAPWSFHRGHPLLRKILPPRAAEVDKLHSPGLREKIAVGSKEGRWTVWKDYSHCAPDWDYILPLGFPGMRERLLANWKDTTYYHSRRIAADAVLRLVERLAEHARRANATTPCPRLAAEAAALARLREGAPRTAYEVLLFIYLEWVMGENFDSFQVRTLSNLDRILTPYYRADIAAGRTTEAEFRDQLRHFWWQWGSIDNYFGQPVYFGGTKADGTTEYNEVSRILLEEHDQLGLPTPKVHIKTGPSTPDWVWRKTLDLARRQRSVTFCGEEPIARAITGLGYTAEQARTCAIWGCYEWGIRDSCNDTIPSYVSALKPIETLLAKCAGKGESWRSKLELEKRVGENPHSNSNSKLELSFETFDSFKAAYFKQLEDNTREARELAFETEKWTHEINPSMLFSLSVEYSVKTGRDAYHDGTAHGNNTHLLLVGLGSTVDALLAVEDIVFKDRVLTLSELGNVMAANWKGHEELRLRMLRSKRKWGNNDPEANALGHEIARCFARQANNIPNSRGGRFVAGGHSSRRFVDFGKRTGATPDGRLAGEEMSKNLSPAPGADTEGVTALINTIAAIDPADLPMDLPLDVMLHPSAVAGDKGLDVMRVLVEQYHAKGFTLIQFNVFDADTLRDAQAHPEKYENLQVRVCGWNVRWNDLPREQQNAYIRRAENIMKPW